MVYCVQAYLVFADAATRNTRLAQAESFITNKQRWDVTTILATEQPDPNSLLITARFTSKSDQGTVDLASRNLSGIQPGSWVQIHDCTHDEEKGECNVENRVEF